MDFLVFGAGMMSVGLVHDLLENPKTGKIVTIDRDQKALDALSGRFNDKRLTTLQKDLQDSEPITWLFDSKDCAINATHYKFNYDLSKIAIDSKVPFCDMGGNNDIVNRQLTLDNEAKKNGITIIPDCGLAPGMAPLVAAGLSKKYETVDSLKIRVGGIPQKPDNLLNYQLAFSVEGLINEYVEKTVILRDGNEELVDSMTGLERIDFPEPFGEMEAFYTSGGTSTLPGTMKDRIKRLDYKTIRYPGHCEHFKLMLDMGLAGSDRIKTGKLGVVPRELFGKLLEEYLPSGKPDAVLVKIIIEGEASGKKMREDWNLIDYYDEKTGLSSMQRTTAFPVSIIAQMLASGKIEKKGVVPQEISVPFEGFMEELKKRNFEFKKVS